MEQGVVPVEGSLLPGGRVCSWLLKVFDLTLVMSLSGNGRQSSSACRAAQVQTEASLGSWRGDTALGLVFFCLFCCF